MQALAVGQDTPSNRLSVTWDPDWFAVRWVDQVVPSQRSARVSPLDEEEVTPPTAMHSVAAGQETPRRTLNEGGLAGLGVGSIEKAVPFQRSARVKTPPEL